MMDVRSNRLPSVESLPLSVIRRVDQLPTLPGVVARLNEITTDPEVSVDEIVRVISLDQSLTTRILRVVNSAY